MDEVTRTIDIDAPAPAVWRLLEDVRRMPELSPSTVQVEAPGRLTAVGDRFEQTVSLAGRRFRSKWTVTAIEPGRCLSIAGTCCPAPATRWWSA